MPVEHDKSRWLRLAVYSAWLACVTGAVPANAQRTDSLGEGTRIRLRTRAGPPDELAGVFLHADKLSLTLQTRPNDREQTQQFANVAWLEKLRDQPGVAKSWRRGAVIGGLVGLAIGSTAFLVGVNQDDKQTCSCLRKHALVAYLLTPPLVAGTAAAGGWITAHNRERWERVPLPPR